MFGDGTAQPVIGNSREITKLGNVVASDIGLQALRNGESLDQAVQKIKDADDDPEGRLIRRLKTGKNSLTAALDDVAEFPDSDEVRSLIYDARSLVDALEAAIGDA